MCLCSYFCLVFSKENDDHALGQDIEWIFYYNNPLVKNIPVET